MEHIKKTLSCRGLYSAKLLGISKGDIMANNLIGCILLHIIVIRRACTFAIPWTRCLRTQSNCNWPNPISSVFVKFFTIESHWEVCLLCKCWRAVKSLMYLFAVGRKIVSTLYHSNCNTFMCNLSGISASLGVVVGGRQTAKIRRQAGCPHRHL